LNTFFALLDFGSRDEERRTREGRWTDGRRGNNEYRMSNVEYLIETVGRKAEDRGQKTENGRQTIEEGRK